MVGENSESLILSFTGNYRDNHYPRLSVLEITEKVVFKCDSEEIYLDSPI